MDKYSKDGSMKAHVESYQKPESAYSQTFEDATLAYVSRQDKQQTGEASKLKKEEYKGRYSK